LRRVLALALMTALCMTFCACGSKSGTDQLAKDINKDMAGMKSLVTIVSVTADYGERVYKYKLRCSYKEGMTELEVLEPEGIKGLKAHVTEKGIGLELGGITLDTGSLFGNGLSPLEGIPMMIKAWKDGYVTETKREKLNGSEMLAMSYDLSVTGSESKITHTVWFDAKSRLPIKAEILSDGYRVLECTFGNVIME